MLKRCAVPILVALAASATAMAQAPDCAGVSVAPPLSGIDYGNQLTTVRIATGFSSPVAVTSAPGDAERLFVVERAGTIDIIKNGVVLGTPFLDIDALVSGSAVGSSTSELGLLGLAFHPDYQINGYFFVYYTDNLGDVNVIRYTRSTSDLADAGSAKQVLFVDEPFANHNGGTIAFGPNDGYLYIGTGDGGSGCDPGDRAQDVTNQLLGKMIRIDVDVDPAAYAIPPDNPFIGLAGDDELWAYGLRNPFRFSFDRINGTLMIGDVGQSSDEEVDCAPGSSPGGENYGWSRYEGSECSSTQSCGSTGSCVIADYVAPVLTYPTAAGDSVIGGYVYQGCRMPLLGGTYFYANYSWNNTVTDAGMFLRSFRVDPASCSITSSFNRQTDLKSEGQGYLFQRIAGFGEDQQGELYFADQYDGEVYKILPILRLMEVSGKNAVPFRMTATDWTWENLTATSGHPISSYRVFRSIAVPTGPFECAFEGATPVWPGGDLDTPLADQVYYYLVLGRNTSGELTRAGFQSDGTARSVLSGSVCP